METLSETVSVRARERAKCGWQELERRQENEAADGKKGADTEKMCHSR